MTREDARTFGPPSDPLRTPSRPPQMHVPWSPPLTFCCLETSTARLCSSDPCGPPLHPLYTPSTPPQMHVPWFPP
eukprot:1177842-Prorocentrum_minimum.AAC.1